MHAAIIDSGLLYYGWRVAWIRCEATIKEGGAADALSNGLDELRRQLLTILSPLADPRHERRFVALPACRRALALLDS
ncbi:MAG: hypothetical protein R3E97_07625 [Candidatus Eisenbacteria bacterium]